MSSLPKWNIQHSLLERYKGFLFAALAAILFGASTPAAKAILPEQSPWLIAGILYLGSGIGLLILNSIAELAKKPLSRDTKLTRSDLPWLAGVTIFGGILGPAFLLTALTHSSASASSLLLNLECVFTTAIAWFVFKENFDRRILLGTIFIIAGSVVLSWAGGFSAASAIGSLFVALACGCWALDNNFTRKISGRHPIQLVVVKSVVAGCVNISLAVFMGATWPSLPTMATTCVVGLLGYGFSLVSFVLALRHIGAARTGAYFSLAPFAGSALAILFLKEPITAQLIWAACFMAAGVWLHLTENHSHEHEHSEVEHAHPHIHDAHHQHHHDEHLNDTSPHLHAHKHTKIRHTHIHFPDTHHEHTH